MTAIHFDARHTAAGARAKHRKRGLYPVLDGGGAILGYARRSDAAMRLYRRLHPKIAGVRCVDVEVPSPTGGYSGSHGRYDTMMAFTPTFGAPS